MFCFGAASVRCGFRSGALVRFRCARAGRFGCVARWFRGSAERNVESSGSVRFWADISVRCGRGEFWAGAVRVGWCGSGRGVFWCGLDVWWARVVLVLIMSVFD